MVGAAGFGGGLQGRLSRERGVNYYWVLMQKKTTLSSGENQALLWLPSFSANVGREL